MVFCSSLGCTARGFGVLTSAGVSGGAKVVAL
jgi:hypothetical protein